MSTSTKDKTSNANNANNARNAAWVIRIEVREDGSGQEARRSTYVPGPASHSTFAFVMVPEDGS